MSQSTDTIPEATAALRAAFTTLPVDEHVLKTAVHLYVDEAKKLNWPIERVIVGIKRVAEIEAAVLYQTTRGDPLKRAAAHAMVSRAVTWCVDHYFWTDKR